MENGARRIIQDHYCNMGRRFREGYHPPRIITEIRAALKNVKDHRNVTLSLPETLLRRFRVHAAERNQSMIALMTEAIRSLDVESRILWTEDLNDGQRYGSVTVRNPFR